MYKENCNKQYNKNNKKIYNELDFHSLNFIIFKLIDENEKLGYMPFYYKKIRKKIDKILYKNAYKKNYFDNFEKVDNNFFDNNFSFFLEKNTIIEEFIVIEHNKFKNNFLTLVHYNFLTLEKNKALSGCTTTIVDYDNQFYISDNYITYDNYAESLINYLFYFIFYFTIPYIFYMLFEFFILFFILFTLFDWSILFNIEDFYLYLEFVDFCNFYFFSYFKYNPLHLFKIPEEFLILILILYIFLFFTWFFFALYSIYQTFLLNKELDDDELGDIEIDEEEEQWEWDDNKDETHDLAGEFTLMTNSFTFLYLNLSVFYFTFFFFFLVEIYAYLFDIFFIFLNFIDLTFYSFQFNTNLFTNFSHLYFLNLFLFCVFVFFLSLYLFFLSCYFEYYRANKFVAAEYNWLRRIIKNKVSIFEILVQNIYSKYFNYFIEKYLWIQMPFVNANFVYLKYLKNILKFTLKYFLIFISSLLILIFFFNIFNFTDTIIYQYFNFLSFDYSENQLNLFINNDVNILNFFFKIDSIFLINNPFLKYFVAINIILKFLINILPFLKIFSYITFFFLTLLMCFVTYYTYVFKTLIVFIYLFTYLLNIIINCAKLFVVDINLYINFYIELYISYLFLFHNNIFKYLFFLISYFSNFLDFFFNIPTILILIFILNSIVYFLIAILGYLYLFIYIITYPIICIYIAYVICLFILNKLSKNYFERALIKWIDHRYKIYYTKKRNKFKKTDVIIDLSEIDIRVYHYFYNYRWKSKLKAKIKSKFKRTKFFFYNINVINNIINYFIRCYHYPKKLNNEFSEELGLFNEKTLIFMKIKPDDLRMRYMDYRLTFIIRDIMSSLQPEYIFMRIQLYWYYKTRLPLNFTRILNYKQLLFSKFDASEIWSILDDKASKELAFYKAKYGENSDLFNKKDHKMPVVVLLRVEYSLISVIIFDIYEKD